MADLTEKELDDYTGCSLPGSPWCRAADEIRRHRAARAADEERIHSSIFDAGESVLNSDIHVKVYPSDAERLADAIATRAAKQLAGAAPTINGTDSARLGYIRDLLRKQPVCWDMEIALLDRLTRSAP